MTLCDLERETLRLLSRRHALLGAAEDLDHSAGELAVMDDRVLRDERVEQRRQLGVPSQEKVEDILCVGEVAVAPSKQLCGGVQVPQSAEVVSGAPASEQQVPLSYTEVQC